MLQYFPYHHPLSVKADRSKKANVTVEDIEVYFFKSERPGSLLGRFATAEEVANLLLYYSSQLSSATNGAAIRVDGGVVRSIL
jgi:NAD(P)-dependent dehydrogenase (short-subunit alcohol dehydrogenase family)